jgi:hypothetical protein
MVIRRDWRDPNKWFCSELVSGALEKCKRITRIPAAIELITPRDSMMMVSALS